MKRIVLVIVALGILSAATQVRAAEFTLSADLYWSIQPNYPQVYAVLGYHECVVRNATLLESVAPWTCTGQLWKNGVPPIRAPFSSTPRECNVLRVNPILQPAAECGTYQTANQNNCLSRFEGSWKARTSGFVSGSAGVGNAFSIPAQLYCVPNLPPPPPPDCQLGVVSTTTEIPLSGSLPGLASAGPSTAGQRLYRKRADESGTFISTEWAIVDRARGRVLGSSPASSFGTSLTATGSPSVQPDASALALIVEHPVHVANGRGHRPRLASLPPIHAGVRGTAKTLAVRVFVPENRNGKDRALEVLYADFDLPRGLGAEILDNITVRERRSPHRVELYLVFDVGETVTLREQLITLPQCCCDPDNPFGCA